MNSLRLRGRAVAARLTASVLLAGSITPAFAAGTGPLALTAQDIRLYLTVMRAAAERVEHPTDADKAAAEQGEVAEKRQRAEYDRFAAAHQGGSKATPEEIAQLKASNPTAKELKALKHARALNLRPDSLIVEERHITPHYWGVKRTIEPIAKYLERTEERAPTAPANLDPVTQRNIAKVKPHLGDIQKLLAAVRHGREPDDDD